jgi:hypothetical protein
MTDTTFQSVTLTDGEQGAVYMGVSTGKSYEVRYRRGELRVDDMPYGFAEGFLHNEKGRPCFSAAPVDGFECVPTWCISHVSGAKIYVTPAATMRMSNVLTIQAVG